MKFLVLVMTCLSAFKAHADFPCLEQVNESLGYFKYPAFTASNYVMRDSKESFLPLEVLQTGESIKKLASDYSKGKPEPLFLTMADAIAKSSKPKVQIRVKDFPQLEIDAFSTESKKDMAIILDLRTCQYVTPKAEFVKSIKEVIASAN